MRIDACLRTNGKSLRVPGVSEDVSVPRPRGLTRLFSALHFCLLTLLISALRLRVAALLVLEFTLRALIPLLTAAGQSVPSHQALLQCQFSLGCALSCTLCFLHEGAHHRSLALSLCVCLALLLARLSRRALTHTLHFYHTHSSSSPVCTVCVSLSALQPSIGPFLRRAVAVAFTLGVVTSLHAVNQHYITETEGAGLWMPLVLCYTLLLLYIQRERHTHTRTHTRGLSGAESPLHSAALRLAAMLVLLLSAGFWVDVLHLGLVLLGELLCLSHTPPAAHTHTL
ncbi:transmembrane protein 82-like isoform X2 [Pangasianodon hypophthalmus]|nr:transmembrane protein 82-like isoform X2 [Pangasianodon hypophthalmus]XP_053098421.1 transmembrane protein 82-like isoform X2 [Pangasianodon hypophthalmus]